MDSRNAISAPPLEALLDLTGRVAVVTGGARGIGLACCARLAEAGAHAVVADRDAAAAAAAAELIGDRASSEAFDVSEPGAAEAATTRIARRLGRLDIWVNCAGVYPPTPLLDLTDDVWDGVVDVNLRGTFACAREAARRMIAFGNGGVIVNVTSTAAHRADGTGVAHYVASKFGVRGLTRSLAVELGGHGIRVLAVAPTVTDTPGLANERTRLEEAGFVIDGLGERLPLGRIAQADDVARVVLFCASDLAGLMTGSTVIVDGGELA